MKTQWFLKSMIGAVCLWVAGPALGYQLTHDYYNRFRSPYRNNVYLSQQVYGARSDIASADTDGDQKPSAAPDAAVSSAPSDALKAGPSSYRLTGYGLQLSAGLEHLRFIQTGVFFSSSQLQNSGTSNVDLRLVDSGVDVKMVMSTPVSNIIVGGAALYSQAQLNINGERLSLTGGGYRGIFEISYFASSQVSLVLSASHTIANYSGKTDNGESVKPVSRTSRVGAGLTVWL
jgi:hypothetical protein